MELSSIIQKIEPAWTIIIVPIWQEAVFRYIPYKLWYLNNPNFWLVGIVSSVIFALIHWYFGKWFVLAAFLAGLIYWAVMVKYGLLAAILTHVLINLIDLVFGIRHIIAKL